ncbi:PQQ-binding-like beta-propeller repeat protein [Paenibacillus dokdonensis]|uniref:PQQ-binding-like beta-propeller repeat protein n=1 Tax=Paenibacillus dokdonensis TaxID=2567944 RepID=A0ABU6GQA6_9BACL|nr:PQQ-binding-like beta-propeller repeat protein [Paenibacillus dokdonensis]MEC0241910.1 PQQ-binding-like beta-propeller repeat protein [Paenibacillus dokdonensis]
MRLNPLKRVASAATLTMACATILLSPLGTAGVAQSSQATVSKSMQSTNKLVFQYKAPYFEKYLTSGTAWSDLKAADYGYAGEAVKVKSVEGDMALAVSDSDGNRWIPRWYTTAAAKTITETQPEVITLSPNTKLFLAPGGQLKWAAPSQDRKLIALAKWKDWVGIMVSPQEWRGEFTVYRPILLWVNMKSIVSKEVIPTEILSQGSAIGDDLARNVTELLLQKGDRDVKVKKLLGNPDVTEHSANLAELGEPMRMGTTWRYERPNAQFTVSFSKEGKLETWKWILPAGQELQLDAYAGKDYGFTYDFRSMPAVMTLSSKPVWRNQGNLNYAYLIGATDQVLLMNGDDGGFSGMHHDASIYAVDRASGRKLWRVDAGFGMYSASLDHSRNTAAVYTAYDPVKKIYEQHLRELSLKDGQVLWEKELPKERQSQIYAAKDIIILHQMPDSENVPVLLTVLDRATGKQLWTKTLNGNQQILSTESDHPYILLREGLELQALNPRDGSRIWSVTGHGDINQDPQMHPYYSFGNIQLPLQPQQSSRWFLVGDKWMLLNMETGQLLAEYPWNRQERFETTNDQRYILVQRSGGLSDYDGSQIEETVLYDIFEKRALWTLPGKAVNGVLDSNRLYVVLNGLPAAVEREKGDVLWQMPVTTKQSATSYTLDDMAKSHYALLSKYLLLGYGSDLLVLRKEDGKVLGRLHDNQVAFSEARYRKGIEGLLNVSAGDIYIGSSNGGLAKYQQTELEKLLDSVQ